MHLWMFRKTIPTLSNAIMEMLFMHVICQQSLAISISCSVWLLYVFGHLICNSDSSSFACLDVLLLWADMLTITSFWWIQRESMNDMIKSDYVMCLHSNFFAAAVIGFVTWLGFTGNLQHMNVVAYMLYLHGSNIIVFIESSFWMINPAW